MAVRRNGLRANRMSVDCHTLQRVAVRNLSQPKVPGLGRSLMALIISESAPLMGYYLRLYKNTRR
jgi:hypothetical protein